MGQESELGLAGSSSPGFRQVKISAGATVSSETPVGKDLPLSLIYWQNSSSHSCGTEVPIFFSSL